MADYRLNTPWPHYAVDWSQDSEHFCQLALGSYLPEKKQNYVQAIALPSVNDEMRAISEPLPVDYVPTKVMWSPGRIKNSEYLAASGDGVYIWRASETSTEAFSLTGRLVTKQSGRRGSQPDMVIDGGARVNNGASSTGKDSPNSPAPITSFDWSKMDPTLMVTASFDTTCTLWSLDTGTIKTQLIAHDKEVFDVAFSPVTPDSFVSVGADGSLRLFDVRSLDHSTILFESLDARPLLRVAWNQLDPNYIAALALDGRSAMVMDVRMPSVPAAELAGHCNPLVSIRWSPSSSGHLITADEGEVKLWDLTVGELEGEGRSSSNSGIQPIRHYSIDMMNKPLQSGPIQTVMWPAIAPDHIALATSTEISIIKL